MWDDEINKKIKEAAGQYHPAYDEDAWKKMEQLLDEHLPQKKKGRKSLYFFLLAVMVCAGLFFIFYKSEKLSSSGISVNAVSKNNATTNETEQSNLSQVKKVKKLQGYRSATNRNTNNTSSILSVSAKKNSLVKITPAAAFGDFIHAVKTDKPSDDNAAKERPGITAKGDAQAGDVLKEPSSALHGIDKLTNNNKAQNVAVKANDNITINDISKDTSKVKNVSKAQRPKQLDQKKRDNNNFLQNLGISAGIGPGVSGVRLSRIGQLSLSYGAGLSYRLTDKFILRTGFYTSKKIYSASGDDYHVQAGSVANYNYLQSINANCDVYEIPFNVSYNFSKVKNHNWFASAGLSSYIMKRESYIFFYKYPAGNTYSKSWTVDNKNRNYFSVLDLSAGYQYAVSKKLFISAEPYLKLPLDGIGAGKIKLSSGGILFNISLLPFKK